VLKNKFFIFQEELETFERNLLELVEDDNKIANNKDLRGIIDFYLQSKLTTFLPTQCHIAGVILALPHGSAHIERLF